MAKKQVGVVLSGCGVYDGAEIHEATLTLYFLDRAGAQAVCMAPNIPQHHVINHFSGALSDETRNVLVESARIARGNIRDLATVKADTLDALILPGGFGAAKNLSTLAFNDGRNQVNGELAALLQAMHALGKPIGAICISPAVLSLARAQAERGWRDLQQAFDAGESIQGEIISHNRGGLVVNVFGVRGFVPLSQISDIKRVGSEAEADEQPQCQVAVAAFANVRNCPVLEIGVTFGAASNASQAAI